MRPAPQCDHERGSVQTRLHRPILETRHFRWPDEAACAFTATAFSRHTAALADATITLAGPLGAGKTTFVRHLLRSLGVAERIKSPTYAVLETYAAPGALAVAHLDCYRFASSDEFDAAGLRDAFAAPGLKLVEWPDHAGDALPPADVALTIEIDDDGVRRVRADALSPRGCELVG